MNTYTLVKFPVTSTCHGWIITTIHFSYMVAFDVGYFVHGKIAGKRYLSSSQGEILFSYNFIRSAPKTFLEQSYNQHNLLHTVLNNK